LFALPFGQTGDDPTIVGDYDGDARADPAVFREGAGPGAPAYWYVWRSSDSTLLAQQWGQHGDTPAPGDYNGDGKHDFVVRRDAGGGAGIFYLLVAGSSMQSILWGTPFDNIVPGDYDGDGRTDIAVLRNIGGVLYWYVRNGPTGGLLIARAFGSVIDRPTQGDYDNDGVTDIAVWRPSPTPGQSAFYVLTSSSGFSSMGVKQWGLQNDTPVAAFFVH
jgi:hypothetical protein